MAKTDKSATSAADVKAAAAKASASATAETATAETAAAASADPQATASTGNAAIAGKSESAGDSGSGEASSASGGAGTAASNTSSSSLAAIGHVNVIKAAMEAAFGQELGDFEKLAEDAKDVVVSEFLNFVNAVRRRLGMAPAPALPTAAGRLRVKVTGPKGGRWRAGHYFTAEPTTVDLTAAELAQVKADPTLLVASPADAGAPA